MKKRILFILVLLSNKCFSERFIQPTKYDYQNEILINGGSVIQSEKRNSVVMFQTSPTIKGNRANFYFSFENRTFQPINLYTYNLRVTDQWGRQIRVIPKQELLADKNSQRNWTLFASAICAGMDSYNAQNAGTVHYNSCTHSNSSSYFHTHGSNGCTNGNVYTAGTSVTHGTIHSEALRQQALRQADQDAIARNVYISSVYNEWDFKLNNYYFDSNTVFPSTTYGANFQIDVPNWIEKDIQYLLFTLDVGCEKHTFCFYCGNEKNWHLF